MISILFCKVRDAARYMYRCSSSRFTVYSFRNEMLCLYLQMQHALFDLLSTALVPELGADVAAGTAGYV